MTSQVSSFFSRLIKAGSGMPAIYVGNSSFADADLTKLTDNKLSRRCISIIFISAATQAAATLPQYVSHCHLETSHCHLELEANHAYLAGMCQQNKVVVNQPVPY